MYVVALFSFRTRGVYVITIKVTRKRVYKRDDHSLHEIDDEVGVVSLFQVPPNKIYSNVFEFEQSCQQ